LLEPFNQVYLILLQIDLCHERNQSELVHNIDQIKLVAKSLSAFVKQTVSHCVSTLAGTTSQAGATAFRVANTSFATSYVIVVETYSRIQSLVEFGLI
jgi:hypothetical protein